MILTAKAGNKQYTYYTLYEKTERERVTDWYLRCRVFQIKRQKNNRLFCQISTEERAEQILARPQYIIH